MYTLTLGKNGGTNKVKSRDWGKKLKERERICARGRNERGRNNDEQERRRIFFYSAVLFLRKGANDGDIKRTKKED